MKKYTVAIEEYFGKIYTDFRQYDNADDKLPSLCFSAEIEPRSEGNPDRLYLDNKCRCNVLDEPRELSSTEIPISAIDFTYYYRSLEYAKNTGEGKVWGAELVASACISCFLFAQFRSNVAKDDGENVSSEIKRLYIF